MDGGVYISWGLYFGLGPVVGSWFQELEAACHQRQCRHGGPCGDCIPRFAPYEEEDEIECGDDTEDG